VFAKAELMFFRLNVAPSIVALLLGSRLNIVVRFCVHHGKFRNFIKGAIIGGDQVFGLITNS
jgi:hypothetical protein